MDIEISKQLQRTRRQPKYRNHTKSRNCSAEMVGLFPNESQQNDKNRRVA